jgi:hypothetical protein
MTNILILSAMVVFVLVYRFASYTHWLKVTLFAFMGETKDTLPVVVERQGAQSRAIAELRRDVERLKRATGLKQAASEDTNGTNK